VKSSTFSIRAECGPITLHRLAIATEAPRSVGDWVINSHFWGCYGNDKDFGMYSDVYGLPSVSVQTMSESRSSPRCRNFEASSVIGCTLSASPEDLSGRFLLTSHADVERLLRTERRFSSQSSCVGRPSSRCRALLFPLRRGRAAARSKTTRLEGSQSPLTPSSLPPPSENGKKSVTRTCPAVRTAKRRRFWRGFGSYGQTNVRSIR
jgi:hypothetical protein